MNNPTPALVAPAKAVFLDRDGVLNHEIGDYVWRPEDFHFIDGVPEALARLKAAGYRLIVVTNQAGIAKGLYTAADVQACHQKLQQACGGIIDAFYFAPGHPSVSESLSRKPDSLMLEKGLARFHLDPAQCWMLGDRARDLEAGARAGVRGLFIGSTETLDFEPRAADLSGAVDIILSI
ncbi:D-alpha,beta-D-heptose 1,7-bisphosphate phosphatase [Hymenobacter daecheongensis DSM 21074]|uniref:D,D-heptose 1,7-bisphosphate phosphatase n=1 Tax=Hymenobacter daecheongensis DSM 21074 TaxID=1121955 RepID=A0A1M6KXG5_9BACT|nr:HAD family hydrolase [Hymenobacter daecheongensis]SHJ63599.1 D-alpha,beta-D-heptose 1,7-bisphosphate phosphatase [Hymenobacter daecheongensis DSM 21074]